MSAIHKMRGPVPLIIVGSVAGLVESTPSSTHAMGNIDVGAASGDKNAILGVTMSDFDSVSITEVTVGGVSLSESVTTVKTGSPDVTASIWAGDISSINGSQAIVVKTSAFSNGVGVSGVVVTGLKSLTPTMTVSATSTTIQTTLSGLSALRRGIVIASAACEDFSKTVTWQSVTEKADLQTDSGSQDHRHTAAWDLGLRVAADELVTFTGFSENSASAGAGFR